MIKPECIDAREVFAHLKALGYQEITPQQLKDFIHDLKKLIKHDQKHLSQCSILYRRLNSDSSSCSCSCTDDNSDKSSSNESYESSVVSECSSSATYNKSFSKSDHVSKKHEKVQSSFIRPWQLPVYSNLSSRNKKNPDPVKLYHQYKETWNKYNIPGESKHSELRWFIRNKMLGQEPSPRVVI